MPVIQIDKYGFIKGTKRKLAMKVIIKKAMMIKGSFVPVGTILDLEGAFLAECLAYSKVEPFIEDPDPALIGDDPTDVISSDSEKSVTIEDEPKKLGPKKRKSKKE